MLDMCRVELIADTDMSALNEQGSSVEKKIVTIHLHHINSHNNNTAKSHGNFYVYVRTYL